MIFKLAWRNIWRNKRRTIITLAMVFIAVFLSVFMRSMQLGTYDKMIDGIVRYTTGYVQIHLKGYNEDQTIDNSFDEEAIDYSQLNTIDGVVKAAPRINGFALGAYKNHTRPLNVIGFEPERENENLQLQQKLTEGTLIHSHSKDALIGEGLAQKLKMNLGDSIVLLGQGYHGQTAAGLYKVAGILKFPSPELNESTVYLALDEAQYLFGAEGKITTIAINLHPNASLQHSKKLIAEQVNNETYEVLDWVELLPELYQGIQGDQAGGIIIILILYMVIGFGILGTILMMTAERQFEYGVLVSIGMKRFKLGLMLLYETIIMTFMGALISIIVVSPFLYYLYYHPIRFGGKAAETMTDMGFEAAMYTSTDMSIALRQTLIVVFISVLLCIYPIIKLQFLKPVEAMRK